MNDKSVMSSDQPSTDGALVLPDQLDEIRALATDTNQDWQIPDTVRNFAASQLAMASALLGDMTPACAKWNQQQAVGCIKMALSALMKGGRNGK